LFTQLLLLHFRPLEEPAELRIEMFNELMNSPYLYTLITVKEEIKDADIKEG
jgi:hypothetical protein